MKAKKFIPLVILSVMVLVLTSIGVIFYARENSKKLENTNSEKVFEKSDIKSEESEDIIDSKKEDDISTTESENNLKTETENKDNTINIVSESSKLSNSSNSSSNNTTNTTQSTTSKSESKQEVQQQQITVPTTSNNDSNEVDTNSFFYSIHKGTINTKTQSSCLGAGEEIAFIDTVDINYYRCYEVTSKDGSILGYYLNIFCNSGNCNRYKSQIDWSKYN